MSSSESTHSQFVNKSDDVPKYLDKDIIVTRTQNKPRSKYSAKNGTHVVVDALCAVMQSTGRLSGRIKTIEGHLSEIPLLRKEILATNEKLDQLLEILKELAQDTNDKSTFLSYFTS